MDVCGKRQRNIATVDYTQKSELRGKKKTSRSQWGRQAGKGWSGKEMKNVNKYINK